MMNPQSLILCGFAGDGDIKLIEKIRKLCKLTFFMHSNENAIHFFGDHIRFFLQFL